MNNNTYKYIRKITPTLDREHKFMFFEIKKSAITSVRRGSLKERAVVYKDLLEKYYAIFDQYSASDIKNMFKFTIIRNPFERTVSAFHYLQRYGFVEFSKNIEFKQFVKTIFKEKGVEINFHFHEMIDRLVLDGELLVDFVARLENIEEDWRFIASKINVVDKLQKKNVTKHEDYRVYYDDESIEIVSNIYSRDIEYFKYNF